MKDLDRVARAVADSKRVVYLTGAGLSVASGIAPYRKSKDAVWANFITDWGTAEKFHENPLRWYREFWVKAHPSLADAREVKPNAGHDAITSLVDRFGHGIITQNIDGLHRKSGAPVDKVIEIHGRADTFVCSNPSCRKHNVAVTGFDLRSIADGEIDECEMCGAPLRPLVLLFDEHYDSQPFYRAREARHWLNDAEVVVFVGTSFSVGITALALQAARYANALLVNVNVDAVDDDALGFVNLLGPAEVTLPKLAAAAGAR